MRQPTPSITTTPSATIRSSSIGAARPSRSRGTRPSPRSSGSTTSRFNRVLELAAVPELVGADHLAPTKRCASVLPAPPRPPMPTRYAAIAERPRPPWPRSSPRWHGPAERRAGARPDRVGVRRAARRRHAPGRVGREAAAGAGRPGARFRGPLRLAEAFALLPTVRRAAGGSARRSSGRPSLVAMVASAASVRGAALGSTLRAPRESAGRAPSPARPAALALAAAGSPPTTAPSTSRSAPTNATASAREGEHDRCGTHLVGPLLVTSAAVRRSRRVPPRAARPGAPRRHGRRRRRSRRGLRLDGTASRHPLARALRRPGHEFQARLATAEPSAAQLEVAEAALAACLEREAA